MADDPAVEHVPAVNPDVGLEVLGELHDSAPGFQIVQGYLVPAPPFVPEVEIERREESLHLEYLCKKGADLQILDVRAVLDRGEAPAPDEPQGHGIGSERFPEARPEHVVF